MKILITGISGLLGPYVAKAFLKSNLNISSIIGIYNSRKPTFDEIETMFIDLSNFDLLNNFSNDFDVIVHCAAVTDVNRCETDWDYAYIGNVLITKNIIDFANKNNSYLIFISTEAVFHNFKNASEEDIPDPKTVYASTKYEAEKLVSKYNKHLILRTTIFGPSLNHSQKLFEHVYNNLMNKVSVKAISDNLFNPISTSKFSKLLVELIKKNAIGKYHINSDKILSRFELYNMIADVFNLDKSFIIPVRTKDISLNVKRSRFTFLNNKKIKSFLNLKEIDLLNQIKDLRS